MARIVSGYDRVSGISVPLACDSHLGVLGVSNYEHVAVDSGVYYSARKYTTGVANGSSVDILVVVPSSGIERALLGGVASVGGDAKIEAFYSPTVSDNGTALTALQVNQLSSNTANIAAYHTPTISDAGTLIFEDFISGGRGGVSVGGDGPFQRLNVAPNTKFLIRVTNNSGTAQTMCININWVEQS